MSRVSCAYVSWTDSGAFLFGVTKDLDVALLHDLADAKVEVKVVYVEEFSTIREATERYDQLRWMSEDGLRKLINLANPEWANLVRTPVAAISPGNPDGGTDVDGGGVAVGSPPPIRPLTGADAKAWPNPDH